MTKIEPTFSRVSWL